MADEEFPDLESPLYRDDQVVDIALKLIRPGERELESRVRRYNHAYDVYRASEKRPRSLEPWQSQLRVPYAQQVIDTELVNIVTGFPRCLVVPRHPEVEMNAKAMQIVIDYEISEDHMVEKLPVFVQQGLIYGVTVAKNHWRYETGRQKQRNYSGFGPGVEEQDMVLRDGPSFEPWNIYDAWWDPGARDVDSARYVVLRSRLSREELRSSACTAVGPHDRGTCDGIYHNVDELLKVGTTSKAAAATAQQAAVGSNTRDRNKDLFEILEIWTDETVTVLGSRKVLLRNDPNPYWFSKKPIVITQTKPDLFELVGISETEVADDLQNGMWTLQNMVIDNIHLTTMRGITYREGGVTDPNQLQLKPRFKWPVVDHDDIRPFEISPVSSDVFEERQRMLSDLQLVTGINPYVSGSDLQTVDQNTATGVTALQEVASRLLRFKASQIQYKGYQRTFEMWGDMIQQFMEKTVFVSIVGERGAKQWMEVSPEQVAGHFRYKLEGSEESLSRQQERGEAIALLNAFTPLAQTGMVNMKPILERVALAYNFPNPEALFNPPQQQPQAAPMQGGPPQQNGQQMPPELQQMMAQQSQQGQQQGPFGSPQAQQGFAPAGFPSG